MSSFKTAIRLLVTNQRGLLETVFTKLNKRGLLRWLGDTLFLRVNYYLIFGKKLNLNNPKTFSEKLQWLKLYDRKPEYIMMVDKIAVKDFISEQIGTEYVIPTLGVWEKPEDVEWDSLPNQFVIKWNHDSGSIVVCKDKTKFDRNAAIKKLHYGERTNGYWYGREWPYKGVKPMLFAEQYMEDETGELRDYKFFCFKGKVKALFIAADRMKTETTRFDFFDENYCHLPFTNGHPNAVVPPSKPVCFEQMKGLAEKLSKNIPQVRVDFYEIRGKVYFGEFTLFHWSGLMPFEPEEWDYTFGDWIEIPPKG